MNEHGLREKALVAVVAVVVLYALAVGVWFFNARDAWKKAAKRYASEQTRYAKERHLIGERALWTERYEKAKAAMPTFESGQATDTTWLRRVEELAVSNHVTITSIKHGAEIEGGDVLELPIEGNWEASLESLVHFMHALENSSEGMFDIQSLTVNPLVKKPGYLKGTLTVTCAYMRN